MALRTMNTPINRFCCCVAALALWLLFKINIFSAVQYPFSVYPYKAKGCYCSGRILAPALPLPPPMSGANMVLDSRSAAAKIRNLAQNFSTKRATPGSSEEEPAFKQYRASSGGGWPPFSSANEFGFGQRRIVNISETPIEHIRIMEANSTFPFDWLEGWRCSCHEISIIPTDLPPALSQLVVSNTNIPQITKAQLAKYKVLKSFELFTDDTLHYIEPGAFSACQVSIRSISIVGAPLLVHIDAKVFEMMPKLAILRIRRSGLSMPPVIRNLASKNAMSEIDFEGCNIEKILSNTLSVSVARMSFDDNIKLKTIDSNAFYGSKIRKLSFRNNHVLRDIGLRAFAGIEHLSVLVLNNTAVRDLPTHGLGEVTELHISHTAALTRFTNILELRSLQVAYVTYPFHCCAFRYPELFAPMEAAVELRKLREYHEAMCELKRKGKLSEQILYNSNKTSVLRRVARSLLDDEQLENQIWKQNATDPSDNAVETATARAMTTMATTSLTTTTTTPKLAIDQQEPSFRQPTDYSGSAGINDITVYELSSSELGEYSEDLNGLLFSPSESGVGSDAQIELICDVDIGLHQFGLQNIECYPEPDAFNPCEDVMGSWVLRVFAWIVLTLALVGNAVVLIVLVSGSLSSSLRRERGDLRLRNANVQKVFVGNLAFADFCMGIYLLMLAIADARSCGEYFNYAKIWQHTGYGCRVAGLFATFASVLSMYVLACITLERWYVIRNAINFQNRLNAADAWKVMLFGWLLAAAAAAMPMLDISDYGMTSICLPMRVSKPSDQAYLLTLLLFNGSTFLLICFCYVHIYFAVNKSPDGNVKFTTKLGGRVISMRTTRRSISMASRAADDEGDDHDDQSHRAGPKKSSYARNGSSPNNSACRPVIDIAEESEEELFDNSAKKDKAITSRTASPSPSRPPSFDTAFFRSSQRSNISNPATNVTVVQDAYSTNGSIASNNNHHAGHNKRATISRYVNAFRSSRLGSTFDTQQQDRKLAMRMALLIFTNFACWAPITFFGTTAALGWPLISVSSSKVLLVFFFPLNSCTNPFLYAILTNSFREDLLSFLRYVGLKRSKQSSAATNGNGAVSSSTHRISRGNSLSLPKSSTNGRESANVSPQPNNDKVTSPLRKSNSSNTRYSHPTTTTTHTRKRADEKRRTFTLTLSVFSQRTSTETTKAITHKQETPVPEHPSKHIGTKNALSRPPSKADGMNGQKLQYGNREERSTAVTDCAAGDIQACCFCAQTTNASGCSSYGESGEAKAALTSFPVIHFIDSVDDEQTKL